MRCLISLTLGLLALKAVLALDPEFIAEAEVMCPEPGSSKDADCTADCLTNENCVGSKCCNSACGSACKTPVNAAQKAGRCPWVQPLAASQPCNERNQCSNDNQCDLGKKCCFSQCAMRCLDPVFENAP